MISDLDTKFSEIEQRYSMTLPVLFREIWRLGWCSGSDFLIMPDMEWMPLQEVIDYQFEDYQMEGFVPFAFTAGGDLWCWQTDSSVCAEPRVVECPHDCDEGRVFALDFRSAIYRHLADAVAAHFLCETDLTEHLDMIRHCLERFRPHLLPQQVEHLDSLLARPRQSAVLPAVRPTQWHFIIPRGERTLDLIGQFPEITFQWMRPAHL
jgi:hypothetical protein